MSLLDSLRMLFRLAAAAALLGSPALLQPGTPASRPAAASTTPRLQNFARIPLSFEANQGQADAQVQYLARGPGYTLFLTATEAVLALQPGGPAGDSSHSPVLPSSKRGSAGSAHAPPEERAARAERAVLRMQLLGSNPAAEAKGADRLRGSANYFLGNEPSQWRTNIATYAQVHYQDVYPGISLVYYGNQRQLEYDFQVAPGADPAEIRLRFASAESVRVDDRGDLLVQAGGQALLQHKPVVYQDVAGERREVVANFVVHGQEVGFALGRYDQGEPLVIDPVLSYSTYLGGSGGDIGWGIAVDGAGNAYVTGNTSSPDFPTANPLQPGLGGAYTAFVAKLAADGSALVYSTYLGGSGGESGNGIAVDAAGNAYVTGWTFSPDFPTVNALQPNFAAQFPNTVNAFVAKLTADGSTLAYSTYLGGSGNASGGGSNGNGDQAFGIAVDAAGSAYVTGQTTSPDFPTANPLQPALGTPEGNAFVAKLTADGSALVYSTYLGGSGDSYGAGDWGAGIAVDAAGNAYVTGGTESRDFPTVSPLQPALGGPNYNAFVAELTADGSALVYSTYLGGSGDHGDYGRGIAVDAAGNAYVTGDASSPDFPTANALQPTLGSPNGNAFVAKIGTVVTPGPAAQFQVRAPAQVTSGTPFDITITAQDANGLTAVGYLGTVTFSSTDADPGVVLPADYTFTAADQGVHTFAGGCTLITAGQQTVTATDTADSTITGTATVNPGP